MVGCVGLDSDGITCGARSVGGHIIVHGCWCVVVFGGWRWR